MPKTPWLVRAKQRMDTLLTKDPRDTVRCEAQESLDVLAQLELALQAGEEHRAALLKESAAAHVYHTCEIANSVYLH